MPQSEIAVSKIELFEDRIEVSFRIQQSTGATATMVETVPRNLESCDAAVHQARQVLPLKLRRMANSLSDPDRDVATG